MSAQVKDALGRLFPHAFAVLVNACVLFYLFGKQEQKLDSHLHDVNLHIPLEKKLELFYTRKEAVDRTEMRNRELADWKNEERREKTEMRMEFQSGIAAVNSKLDRLIEHELANVVKKN